MFFRLSMAVALSALAFGCSGSPAGGRSGAGDDIPVPAVEAVPARSGSLPLVERLSGVARAANQFELRAEIAAVVRDVRVRSGERVVAGQALVLLDDRGQRERLNQALAATRLAEAAAAEADARLAELEAETVRARALAEQALVSELDLETLEARLAAARAASARARAGVEQARATADERRADLERTVVRSPIDGHVGRRNVEPGVRVDPGTTLFVVGSLDRMVVEVSLTESMLDRLAVGDPVRLAARSADTARVVEARLSRISPFLSDGSFSTSAEIDVPNADGDLRPGMFLAVDVLYGESDEATLIPTAALWEDPRTGNGYVFVVDRAGSDDAPALPDRIGELSDAAFAVERRTVGRTADGRGSIGVEGIEPGEWVVTVGQHLLAEMDEPVARVRRTTWSEVEALQSLQREDLLDGFLDKQRRVAAERGATPPSSESYVGGSASR